MMREHPRKRVHKKCESGSCVEVCETGKKLWLFAHFSPCFCSCPCPLFLGPARDFASTWGLSALGVCRCGSVIHKASIPRAWLLNNFARRSKLAARRSPLDDLRSTIFARRSPLDDLRSMLDDLMATILWRCQGDERRSELDARRSTSSTRRSSHAAHGPDSATAPW